MLVAEPLVRSWKARLALEFTLAEEKTKLSRKSHDGPLLVQKPLYPEGGDVCHAIVVHPPGGIAGGDELLLEAKVAERACALLTTPGAAKWYRSGGPWAGQKLRFDVHGTLEWLPQEAIVFDAANVRSSIDIHLREGGATLGWDIVALGRHAAGERFDHGLFAQTIRFRLGDRLAWVERTRVEGGDALLASPIGLAGHHVLGCLWAAGTGFDDERMDALRASLGAAGELAAVTRLAPQLVVARALGASTQAVRAALTAAWAAARPLMLHRPAEAPRLWAT
jgi:urease accessory protein